MGGLTRKLTQGAVGHGIGDLHEQSECAQRLPKRHCCVSRRSARNGFQRERKRRYRPAALSLRRRGDRVAIKQIAPRSPRRARPRRDRTRHRHLSRGAGVPIVDRSARSDFTRSPRRRRCAPISNAVALRNARAMWSCRPAHLRFRTTERWRKPRCRPDRRRRGRTLWHDRERRGPRAAAAVSVSRRSGPSAPPKARFRPIQKIATIYDSSAFQFEVRRCSNRAFELPASCW